MGPKQYGENSNKIFKMCRIQLKNHTAHEEHKIEHAWESDHQIPI